MLIPWDSFYLLVGITLGFMIQVIYDLIGQALEIRYSRSYDKPYRKYARIFKSGFGMGIALILLVILLILYVLG